MQKFLIVVSSFFVMLCLGSVYAWSIVSSELITNFGFSSIQTQLVFGLVIAVFPVTMIFAGKYENKLGARKLTILSSIFFSAGYIISGLSSGNFYIILLGIGLLAGIGTGFGYLAALTTPVKWFPAKKGLVTGIAAGGFGLAAFIFSIIIEKALSSGKNILDIFLLVGIVYGLIIFLFSNFLKAPDENLSTENKSESYKVDARFFKLFFGIFFGTFAGLIVIGNLKLIGSEHEISNHILIIGVSVFAIANFIGRLAWGNLSDITGASICIFFALLVQSISIFLLGFLDLNSHSYLILSALIGFGFGGNFVLFAKKTSQTYGVNKLGLIYPYVFLGYAIAGIIGPLSGGIFYDYFNNYDFASYVASFMSLIGALIFFKTANKKIIY